MACKVVRPLTGRLTQPGLAQNLRDSGKTQMSSFPDGTFPDSVHRQRTSETLLDSNDSVDMDLSCHVTHQQPPGSLGIVIVNTCV